MEGGGGVVVVPPGFRFYPTEEELVSFYLKNKIKGNRIQDIDLVIPQLDVYGVNPWDLPQYAGELCHGDPEQWFFFVPRQEKEERGGRPCRLTNSGYWKATGSPCVVYSSANRAIGLKRTMVFYNGRAPTGKKTDWKMNEYKVFKEDASSTLSPKPSKFMQELSLCRVYVKSKCLRAFDRRPSGMAIRESKPIQQMHHNEDFMAMTPHFKHLPVVEERWTSSHDRSSNSLEDHTTNLPLWNQEEYFNWF